MSVRPAPRRRRTVLRVLAGIVVLAGLGAGGIYWLLTVPRVVAASTLPPHTPDLGNGETAFNAGGCASCHATPGQKDRLTLGGGLALASPFGTFHVPNISPDPNDGIGRWSEAEFVTAMVEGTAPDGSHYYPAFPYPSYRNASVGDLRDLFAYLKTLPPVAGRVRDHELAFPFNIRRNVGIWKALFLNGEPFKPDAAQSAEWKRGAYLVNSLGHCAECHSPRNVLGGIVAAQRFAGGPDPEGKGFVPNITAKGIGDWSADDLAYFLKTGETPDGDTTGGSMVQVVRNLSHLSEDDRAAMATYLKSLPAVEGPARPKKK
ncbi:MAG: cytochrome c [Xanthobacteraceae bacterium]